MTDGIGALSLSGRVVLLSVTGLELDGETPVHTGEVVRACSEHMDVVDLDSLGRPAEAEVNRALNRLEAEGLVADTDGETSPVGKGRPSYVLDVEADAVLDELAGDGDVAALAERIDDGH